MRACGVCGFVLDIKRDGSAYVHAQSDALELDHLAVPVDPLTIYVNWRCDFCNSPEPVAVVPARDFDYPDDPRHNGSRGNWLVCASQAPHIADKDAAGLLADVERCWPQHHGGEEMGVPTRVFLKGIYRALMLNITGPLQPFSPDNALNEPV